MDKITQILKYVQKTNPSMDKKHLIEELSKCHYSAVALCVVCESDKRLACNE